jgi:Type I phosphodiesterase / nucleotide pyrophosphatase
MMRPVLLSATLAVALVVSVLATPYAGGSRPPARPAHPPIIRDVSGAGPQSTRFPDTHPRPTTTLAPRLPTAPRLPRAHYVVLIVLDGARPEYLKIPGIPHVAELIKNGTRYDRAWAGILESETPSGHAALATGSDPNRNGILSFGWASGDNVSVNLFNQNAILSGQMEAAMRQAGAPSIAQLVHEKYPHAEVVALGGHKYYAQDAMGGPDADGIAYYTGTPDGRFVPISVPGHVLPKAILSTPGMTARSHGLALGVEDHLAMKLAATTFTYMHQQVTLLNLPEFDWPLGHVDGGVRDPKGVHELMHTFDRDLGMLEDTYRKAGVLDKTAFIVTADHGMTPIYHTVSQGDIDRAVAAAGTSIVSSTYHTSAYLWVRDNSRAPQAAENIAALQSPYIQSVYFKEAIVGGFDYVRASGLDLFRAAGTEAANQYLLHSFDGPNGPDVVVFFMEDTASLPGGEALWKGDHGGADWEAQHIPLLFSGAGVRRAFVSSFPARLIDIAPTLLTLLGAPTTGMQGTPLFDGLRGSSSAARRDLKALGTTLAPIVDALQRESWLEVSAR